MISDIKDIECLIQWHLTEEERKQVADGLDIFLFYDPNTQKYALQLAPQGTGTEKTESALVKQNGALDPGQ